jgi:hypothetical protein
MSAEKRYYSKQETAQFVGTRRVIGKFTSRTEDDDDETRYWFKNISIKLKKFEYSERGFEEKKKHMSGRHADLDLSLYDPIRFRLKNTTEPITVPMCAYYILSMMVEFVENNGFDDKYISNTGFYVTLDGLSLFINLEKGFYVVYTSDTYETEMEADNISAAKEEVENDDRFKVLQRLFFLCR